MANQTQSIVDQEKTVNSAKNCRSSLKQETFEELTERALHLSTTEEELFGSLAESLASQGVGFAIANIQKEENSLLLKALYAPNGTNLTSRIFSSSPDSNSPEPIKLITALSEDLEGRRVLFMSAIDELVADCGGELSQAFNNHPVMITRLRKTNSVNEIIALCGPGLDEKWLAKAETLADKLASAIEIIQAKSNLSDGKEDQEYRSKISKEGLLLTDEHGIIQDANQRTLELLNCADDELLGRNIVDVLPEEKRFFDSNKTTLKGSVTVIKVGSQDQKDSVRYLHVEQHPVTIEGRNDMLLRLSDLSDRWREDETFRQLGKLGKRRPEDQSVGIFLQDLQGCFSYVNPAAAEILGYSLGELNGEHWTRIVPEDEQDKMRQAMIRRMREEGNRYEIQLLHKRGKRIDVLVSESPYHENECYVGTFIFTTDITALRRAEAAVLQKNREFQQVFQRLSSKTHGSIESFENLNIQAVLQQLGDELEQLGLISTVATFNPKDLRWRIEYSKPHLQSLSSAEQLFDMNEEAQLAVDLHDPSLVLLQSGETLFIEGPQNSKQRLVSQISSFELVSGKYETYPQIIAPLSSHNQLFGVLIVCGETLKAEDIPTVTAFANYLSISFQKARVLENTLVQAKLGETLADITNIVSHERDMARMLQAAGELILGALNLPYCTFSVVNLEDHSFHVLLSVARPNNEISHSLPTPGNKVELEDSPITLEDLSSDRAIRLPDSRWLFASSVKEAGKNHSGPLLVLPLTDSGEIKGLASFNLGVSDRKLSQDEVVFLQTSVVQISGALEKVRRSSEAELKTQINQAISVMIEKLLANRDLDEVIRETLGGVVDILPCHFVCLTRFDLSAKNVKVLGVSGAEGTLEAGQIIPSDEWDGFQDLTAGKVIHYRSDQELDSTLSIVSQVFNQGLKSWLSMPLQVQGEVIGALSIGSRQSNIFIPDNLAVVMRLQEPLAIALTNASCFIDVSRRANEFAALYKHSLEIAGETEIRSLLRTSLRSATKLLDAMMGAVFLVEDATEEIVLGAELGLPIAPSVLRLCRGQGLAGKIWEKKAAIIVRETRDLGDPRWLEACYATGSAIGAPLFRDGEVTGVLVVYTPGQNRHFGYEEANLLERMAAQVSQGIENVQNLERINRRVSQLRVVNDLARRISAILIEDLLFTDVVRRVAHALNLELVVLFLVEGDELVEAASYYLPADMYGNWEPIKLKIGGDGISGLVANEGEPFVTSNVANDPHYLSIFPIKTQVQSAVGIPLKLKGKVTGVLFVGSQKLAAFDNADVEALQTLGAHISTCVENARMYEQTKEVQYRLAESEKLRALGLMTSGVATDFNNMLSVIQAHAELALDRIVDQPVRGHMEQIVFSAKEGRTTVRRLQDFARNRKGTSDFVVVDPNQMVKEAIELSRSRWGDLAQYDGIDIEVVTEFYANGYILGSPNELKEVLVNLFLNGVEAMPNGGTITITTFSEGDGLTIIITDTGVGMTSEAKKQVFVPFFTTKPGKTGLGLSMGYGVVQRHGGTIEVQSKAGEGTIVKIWLPISHELDLERDHSDVIPYPALVEPVTILIVEDEDSIRQGLVDTFSNAGHRVLSAANGLEGFERYLEAGKLDVVFTDLSMPKLSGWELIEQLRAFDQQLPIVILSVWADEIDPMKVQQYGIAKVLGKPFELARLHIVLQEVLDKSKELD